MTARVAVLSRDLIGYRTPTFEVEGEKGRLRQFAKAIGERDPVYMDEAARAPPATARCRCRRRSSSAWRWSVRIPYDWFAELGIPLGWVLHGAQDFVYHAIPARALCCASPAPSATLSLRRRAPWSSWCSAT